MNGDYDAPEKIMPDTALEAALLDLVNRVLILNGELLDKSTRGLSAGKCHLLEDVLESITAAWPDSWPDSHQARLAALEWLRFKLEHQRATEELEKLTEGSSE